jgi:hypothetical protein
MSKAKVIEMRTRPVQSAHLCFEVGGILDELDVQLGRPVQRFDFDFFCSNLTIYTAPGDDSRLAYDSQAILSDPTVVGSTLARLRAVPIAATLDRAIRARQNTYFAKYANMGPLATMMYNQYGPGSGAKLDLLNKLYTIANSQIGGLLDAYNADAVRNPSGPQKGVVKRTESHIESTGEHNEQEMSQGGLSGDFAPLPPGGQAFSGPAYAFPGPTTDTEWQGSTGETQKIVNQDYGYRAPFYETEAQGVRTAISLKDQQFAAYMDSQKMINIDQILGNELESMDLDVKRLQVAFLNTILLTPINGVVTGIYKNPGEIVRAGEPVIRVEDNRIIFLLATVVHRGLIVAAPQIPAVPPGPPNSNVAVQTKLLDVANLPNPLTGTVVSARGHREEDIWDLVVQCDNPVDSSNNPIIPLGYHFDYDDTDITIS